MHPVGSLGGIFKGDKKVDPKTEKILLNLNYFESLV